MGQHFLVSIDKWAMDKAFAFFLYCDLLGVVTESNTNVVGVW